MRCLAPVLLAMTIGPASASDLVGIDWQLLAIDGEVLELDIVATLRIEADGTISGKAPCNSYGSRNGAALPALSLGGIRATRMACDKLKEEQTFFDALSVMSGARMDGPRNLILTGPNGRMMEFVLDRMNSLTRCLTCPPKD